MTTSQEKPKTAAAASEFSRKLDQEVAEMQSLLKHLADKAEEAEREAEQGVRPANAQQQQRKVADAFKDMTQAEQAIGSFEARLDQLLGNLDKMLEAESQDSPQADEKSA